MKRGWYPYKAKAGYMVHPATRELVIDSHRFSLLRRAWELMLTKAYTVPQIQVLLNSWGYRTPKNRSGGEQPMTRSGMYRLFNDSFYAGVFAFDGAQHLSKHEPMVTLDEFKAVQRILNRQGGKHEKRMHAFAGLISCGICGCKITAETHVKHYTTSGESRSYTYYHCTGRKGCRKLSLTESDLEAQILIKLEGCRLNPAFVDWALGALNRERLEERQRTHMLDEAASSSEQAVQRRIDRLFDMRENTEISKEEFIERKAKYTNQLTALQLEGRQASTKRERDRQTLESILMFTREWYGRITGDDPWSKRLVASTFAKSYVLTLGELSLTCHPAIDRIRTFEPPKSPDNQIGPGGFHIEHSVWRAFWDEVRTLVESVDEEFVGLPLPSGHES